MSSLFYPGWQKDKRDKAKKIKRRYPCVGCLKAERKNGNTKYCGGCLQEIKVMDAKWGELVVVPTKARCGHLSYKARYFKCETCQPELKSVDDTFLYHGDSDDDMLEDNCE